MNTISALGARIVLLCFLVQIGISGINKSWADSGLPSVSALENEFSQLTNENTRFQFLGDLEKYAETIVKEGKEVEYIAFFKRCYQTAKDKGDASWAYDKARQNISSISEFRIQKYIQNENLIVPTKLNCESFSTFFAATRENFQYKYLNETALYYIMENKDYSVLEDYYQCVSSMKTMVPANTPDYIVGSFDTLLSTISLVYLTNFKNIDQVSLEPWLGRIQPSGIQKLLSNFNDKIVISTIDDMAMIKKIIWASRYFYQTLWDKYHRDPYSDWQYKAPLQTINRAIMKMRKFNWAINLDDIEFITTRLEPLDLMNFCDQYGLTVTESALISKLTAQQLIPSFNNLDLNLRTKNIETNIFPKAYALIKTLTYTRAELEGIYKVDLKGFTTLTIAFVNDKSLTAGFRSHNDAKNMGFQDIEYDLESQTYKAQVEISSRLNVLSFKLNEQGGISGCLNFECFKGQKVVELPNYLTIAETRRAGPEFEVTGVYKGNLVFEDGGRKPVNLKISFINNLIADFDLDYLHIHQSYQSGLKSHDIGIVYLSTGVNSLGALNFIRAVVEKKNGVTELSGVWFSSNRGPIGKLILRKVNDI
jgi:hypothetical protein